MYVSLQKKKTKKGCSKKACQGTQNSAAPSASKGNLAHKLTWGFLENGGEESAKLYVTESQTCTLPNFEGPTSDATALCSYTPTATLKSPIGTQFRGTQYVNLRSLGTIPLRDSGTALKSTTKIHQGIRLQLRIQTRTSSLTPVSHLHLIGVWVLPQIFC